MIGTGCLNPANFRRLHCPAAGFFGCASRATGKSPYRRPVQLIRNAKRLVSEFSPNCIRGKVPYHDDGGTQEDEEKHFVVVVAGTGVADEEAE